MIDEHDFEHFDDFIRSRRETPEERAERRLNNLRLAVARRESLARQAELSIPEKQWIRGHVGGRSATTGNDDEP